MNTKNDVADLHKLKSRVDAAVKENFGTCPSADWFCNLESKLRGKELAVKTLHPEEWKRYQAKYY